MKQFRFAFKQILKPSKWLVAALIYGLLGQLAQATERETLALHQNDRNWPIATVNINGQPSRALLDTGATIAMINADLMAYEASQVQSFETRVLGIGGQRLYPVAQLSTLTAGTHSWQDLRVAVNTENRFPVQQNILPVSMFDSKIVDFDFRNARVEFYDGHPKFVRGARRSALSYRDVDGLIFIPIRINGVRGKALIDTGAAVSFVNQAYARRGKGVARVQDKEEIQGSDLERNKVTIYTFRKLQFGNNQISKFEIPVFETDLFSELGFDEAPMMVIGMDLLRHFRLQVDFERKRLTFLH